MFASLRPYSRSQRGANIDKLDDSNASPLIYACTAGHVDVVRLLAAVRARSFAAPVRRACSPARRLAHSRVRWCRTATRSSQRGANIGFGVDATPLAAACAGGHMAVVAHLIEVRRAWRSGRSQRAFFARNHSRSRFAVVVVVHARSSAPISTHAVPTKARRW